MAELVFTSLPTFYEVGDDDSDYGFSGINVYGSGFVYIPGPDYFPVDIPIAGTIDTIRVFEADYAVLAIRDLPVTDIATLSAVLVALGPEVYIEDVLAAVSGARLDMLAPYFFGSYADDWVFGTLGDDIIFTGPGNDEVTARDGDDEIFLGEPFFFLEGELSSPEELISFDGDNTAYGGSGNDIVYGGNGNDLIYGGDDNDQIYAEEGMNEIYAGSGNDFVSAGHGDFGRVPFRVAEVSGFGTIGEDQFVDLGGGDDLAQTGAGNDVIRGWTGDDTINSGAGNDVVNGDAGNDLIMLTDGDNVVRGGADADVFDLTQLTFGNNERGARSVVFDFNVAEDQILMANFGGFYDPDSALSAFIESSTQRSFGAVWDNDAGARVRFRDLDLDDLTAANFADEGLILL